MIRVIFPAEPTPEQTLCKCFLLPPNKIAFHDLFIILARLKSAFWRLAYRTLRRGTVTPMNMTAGKTHPMLLTCFRGRLLHTLCNRFERRCRWHFHASIECPLWCLTYRTFVWRFLTLSNKTTGKTHKMFFWTHSAPPLFDLERVSIHHNTIHVSTQLMHCTGQLSNAS